MRFSPVVRIIYFADQRYTKILQKMHATLHKLRRVFDFIDMFIACKHALNMKMIQIRNVPDELHRRLKARAALEGTSLSDYLRAQIQAVAERPTIAELRQRLKARSPVRTRESAADAVRAERDAR